MSAEPDISRSDRFSHRTVAITVTYNPDIDILAKQFDALSTQCHVVIVDNASMDDARSDLAAYIDGSVRIESILLDENIGISSAQNLGIAYIREKLPETDYILLLDHDSIPDVQLIRTLELEADQLSRDGIQLGAIGPLLFDPRDNAYIGFHKLRHGIWKKVIPPANSLVECDSLNSSGSLICMMCLNDVGDLTEDFFMDHGETEWCFRALHGGWKIYGTTAVKLNHRMGDDVCEYWLFGKRRMPYRSPKRHYYIVRNSILMYRLVHIPLLWKVWNGVKIAFTLIYFGYFSNDAPEQRQMIVRGFRDGVRGITGPLKQ